MQLPHWMRTIEQRNWQNVTPKQAAVIDKTWRNASRRGMAAYVLTRGTMLFLWSACCLTFFGYLAHTLAIMRQTFYLASVIPCLLLFSIAAPSMFYLLWRHNAQRLTAWRAAHPDAALTAEAQ